MNEKTKRLKALVRYLLTALDLKTQGELARMLGYKTDSGFSQIINGIQEVPQILLERIKNLGLGINTDWILTGEGEMLLTQGQTQHITGSSNITQQSHSGNNTVSTDDRLISIIEEQSHQLTTSQEQITQLISIIREKL